MTEDDVVRIVGAYIEGLFPKVCTKCGRQFASLREYLQQTTHVGSPTFDEEINGQPLAEPLGPMSLANCSCGTTLTVDSDGIPRELMAELLAWARSEASRRSVTIPEVLHRLRERIDAQVLGEDERPGQPDWRRRPEQRTSRRGLSTMRALARPAAAILRCLRRRFRLTRIASLAVGRHRHRKRLGANRRFDVGAGSFFSSSNVPRPNYLVLRLTASRLVTGLVLNAIAA